MVKEHIYLRNWVLFLGDIFLIIASVFASFVLRLEFGFLFRQYLPQAYWMALIAIIVKPLVYYRFGLYRRLWAYASTRELKLIFFASTMASIAVGVGIIILVSIQDALNVFPGFPRSIPAIDWLLSLFCVGGLRFALRLLAESKNGQEENQRAKRVLIIGAGSAGTLVVRELQRNPQVGLNPVCFLDDDSSKIKHQIHSIPVDGPLGELPRVVRTYRVEEAIIAIPSAPGRVVRRVTEVCRRINIPFRTMPGLYELLGGKINVTRLRDVEITDLLRRQPVKIDDDLIGLSLSGKRVLVTGGGGSIGLELCRQVARWGPSGLVMLGHGENSVFEAMLELQATYPSLPIYPVIADIRDTSRLYSIFEQHRPQVVFHAAAHKHVTLMEVNVEEAITNNILGTRNVLEMAINFDTERLVMISSDKAVRPTSVMGATKRIAEMLVMDASHRTGRAFSVVRFGNVLGSRGSIVPIFKRQIAQGGPITITHPEMKRFFMTIPEAVHLVLQASAMGTGGEMFILNMGEQVKILDLAEDLIRLSGLEPGKDVEIAFTGIRSGEKLREELWDERSNLKTTKHPEILRMVRDEPVTGETLEKSVDELIYLAREGDASAILNLMDKIVPGSTVSSTPPPDLISVI
ncbi:MAG TPA: nucleoside-diphosphate sugar epimerase/dehydratase [Anaerolineales bacterium]|nr:nucleoside-diphosphate sugar epimerase/dehydratase [Anaerolineales bacterium]